jgi:serine/threonine protein kinase
VPVDVPAEWAIPRQELNLVRRIGFGATSEVWRANWRGTDVAVKQVRVPTDGEGARNFCRELGILMKLRHPHLVLFMGATRTDPTCIVSELCEGGTLFDCLHKGNAKFSWDQRHKVCTDVAKGVNFLHCSTPQIVHRDLKSLNVFLLFPFREDCSIVHCKVGDFGLSRIRGDSRPLGLTGAAGTYQWMAPEVLEGRYYTEKVDVYSYGILLFEVLSGRVPFHDLDMDPAQIAVQVAKGLRPEHNWLRGCPPRLAELAPRCWQMDPSSRPSFDEILASLSS